MRWTLTLAVSKLINEMEETGSHKETLTGLAAKLGRLPAEKRRVAIEMSAALAGVSLRVSRDFVEAVPRAAKILSSDDLRLWAELGRRLAMGNVETGSSFFNEMAVSMESVPEIARSYALQICTRQLVLSSSTALASFNTIPKLAAEIADDKLLVDMLKLAAEIASRSAKHSSDFLKHTPLVAAAIKAVGESQMSSETESGEQVAESVLTLGSQFANRTGGMTADLWAILPQSLFGLNAASAVALANSASKFLEHGGSVTLHFVSAGGSVLQHEAGVFSNWCDVVKVIAPQGNANLIAFLKATPKFLHQIAGIKLDGANSGDAKRFAIARILRLIAEIAQLDAESSLAAFRSSASALRTVSLDQYEEWINLGMREMMDAPTKSRRSFFALETRYSNDLLRKTRTGLHLEDVQHVLRMYIEGLTGREIEIAPQSSMPQESRIGDGKTVYLPNSIAEFDTEEMDFRLFKVLAAYGAGQIEFGTFVKDTVELKAAFADLADLYSATADQIDAFSLAGYIEDVQKGERALSDRELQHEKSKRATTLSKGSDYKAVLDTFPEPALARKIFTTMENARIDGLLRSTYRGLSNDLDLMRQFLKKSRPFIFDVPFHQVPFELLFQITLCGGATEDAKSFYGQIVSEIETVVEKHLHSNKNNRSIPTVADSLFATSRVYNLFQNIAPEHCENTESEEPEDKSEFSYDDNHSDEAATDEKAKREDRPQSMQDLRDLFNAWNADEDEGEPDDLQGSEAWSHNEVPEQAIEAGEEAFSYDEWDRELNDYRVGWSRVVEKRAKHGDRTFVELTRSRYRGVISSIRHQFQLMKPENLSKINRELDGEDYDLNSLIDFVVDRKADGRQSENIYTKRLRRQRDVSVSLLLDQSSSTARTITRNPLQPYTFPGRRIIEIEKEGLVLMSEALEAVGDIYSLNGFTSEGRRNVKFYVFKDFDEKYSDETEKRIGGITFQNNTRLGAAIRHAAHKLLRQESRTKLLIILTDGRPYDHDYGDARYAREDVREALIEAKTHGITPFCITIDRESEAELRDLYGDVGYTIIDDVLSLPERLPNIYRRLTS